tara:strand:- start:1863 stop:3542 length:1680 start_codon:yes stop_codon:yes gene_type:complete
MPANMYPSFLSKETLGDPSREAEVMVYNALRDELTDSFHVFYNCDWHDTTKRGRDEEGEADFVIAHETYGFLVIEVKGGIISRDEKTREWFSTTRNKGVTHSIKNPIHQAKKSKHYLIKKLKEMHKDSLGFLCCKHCVVFPHSGKPKAKELGADMPLDIFAFEDDMSRLGKRLIQILIRDPDGTNTDYAPLTQAGIKSIHDLFNRGFRLEPSVLTRVRSCEFQIEELTNKQKECLKSLNSFKRLMVAGPAGTGKTCLAIEKSISLSEEGFEVLYLCHNDALAKYLQKRLAEYPNIKVSSYFKFCLDVARQLQIQMPDKNSPDYWDDLALILLKAEGKDESILKDAIIIDEGQDFIQDWVDSLETLLRDKANGLFYLFHDDNQRIYNKNRPHAVLSNTPKYELYKNIRNSKPIFEVSSLFYQGQTLEASGPDGLDIELIESSESARNRTIEKCLNKLINNEDVDPNEIAILTAKSLNKFGGLSFKAHKTRTANDIDGEGVVVDNIYRFKGLEKEVVILIDLKENIDNQALIYVGTSRARSYLIIIDDKSVIETLSVLRGR